MTAEPMGLPRLTPCLICFQRAGLSLPADLLSLLRQRKQAKKGDPGACDPCAALRGNLRHPTHQAGAAKLVTRLAAFHSNSCSESDHEASVSCGTVAHLMGRVSQAQAQGECRGWGPGPCECCAVLPDSSIDFIAARTWIQGSRGIKHSNFL